MSNGRQRLSWEETALKLAHEITVCRSEDPYVQVGACIIKNDGQILLGYNGAPSGIEIDWADRDERRSKVIHAEENVLDEVKKGETKIFAVTHSPCPSCMRVIANKKISKVFFSEERPDFKQSLTRAREFGIMLIQLKNGLQVIHR